MYATCTFFRWPFSVNVIWTARWAGLGGRRMADAYRAPPAAARGTRRRKVYSSVLSARFIAAAAGVAARFDRGAGRNSVDAGKNAMARRAANLAKRSLVVNERELREWVRLGGFRNESDAVRAAVSAAIAIRRMQDAISDLQRRRTFGRRLA